MILLSYMRFMIALVLLVYGDKSEYKCLKKALDVTVQLSLSCWKTLHCSSMHTAGKYQLKKKELYIPSHQSRVDFILGNILKVLDLDVKSNKFATFVILQCIKDAGVQQPRG